MSAILRARAGAIVAATTLLGAACGPAAAPPVEPDPRSKTIPLLGEHQGLPKQGSVPSESLRTLPPGGGPRMSDGEAARGDDRPPPTDPRPSPAGPASASTSFFVTSTGSGDKGGDLGGLAGADETCRRLASSAGLTKREWKAYLSTSKENARDRIGRGPWFNAAGKQVSASRDELGRSGVPGPLVLDERGGQIDLKNAHDVFTGSKPDGTFSGQSCRDWTSASPGDKATVGHADARDPTNKWDHWSSTHETHGCDRKSLQGTAGQGHLYCFASD
jgi:hypothetical protein